MLEWFFKGGLLMYPILLCSVAGVAIFTYKFFQFRSILRCIERPLALLKTQKPKILQPIFEALASGGREQELSIAGTGLVRALEKGLSWLSLMTTIAPLLGLTGTVQGMITTFYAIEKTQNAHPAVLAGGIYVALITTIAGLLVAVPLHVGHHYLEREADEMAFIIKEIIIGLAGNDADRN